MVRATVFTLPDDLFPTAALSAQPNVGMAARWIAGNENALTRRAAEGVLSDDLVYNPVVVYGPTGIGKSAFLGLLTQLRGQKTTDVLSTTGSDFSRTYGRAMQQDALDTFRNRLRKLNVFVIDEVQSLADKTPSQLELVRTIDAIVRRGGLVLAALRQSPLETSGLIPSLVSRLASGLCIPLHAPRRETQALLLKYFLSEFQLQLSDKDQEQVLSLLNHGNGSSPTPGTIRRITESLARLIGNAENTINNELLEQAVRQQTQLNQPKPQQIVVTTARYFHLPTAELRGPSRRSDLVRARSLAMYLIRTLNGASLQEIGHLFGDRDHTTVMHSLKKIESLAHADPETKQALADLLNTLANGVTA